MLFRLSEPKKPRTKNTINQSVIFPEVIDYASRKKSGSLIVNPALDI
jgi:hypothetical protein